LALNCRYAQMWALQQEGESALDEVPFSLA
jgi:hypothetical protein